MDDYLIGIGKRIKEIRKKKGLTINNIAGKADLSNGLISRIENGRTIPSLPVLLSIVNVLDIAVPDFFKDIPLSGAKSFIVSRREDHTVIEKEDEAKGFEYRSLLGKQVASVGFEALLLEVQPGSQREKVETDAFEFKYILSGECLYQIGDEEVLLKEGDALFFDGRIPHVPVNTGIVSAKMLVMYFFLPRQD
ncbi:XRE family transcriptional regulator [Niabella sp. CC-SYL272]|uniref:helix-turn-helix domain-containing protein n=1 Tax=Niabella agricola TaxID=2891571 RepID=UPI001F2986C9|nr:XRE family transcriptional regulator [Niabella agricola]MCF3108656.1 XRE family transcriptional regulator [Niabella agricola]